MASLPAALVSRLQTQARASRWKVTAERFQQTLEASVAKAFAGGQPASREIERYLASLHLEDLALACACAAGDETAWEHFVREFRPSLYRSADAIDPSGGARDLADAMYGELFGLQERDGVRQSLFRYFHGRSSLATWLRAVLAQRHVDRIRSERRLVPLPEDDSAGRGARPDRLRASRFGESAGALAKAEGRAYDRQHSAGFSPDPDRPRHVELMRRALSEAIAALEPRDRLRLGCYYAQDLSLAAIGRALGEHEATVSRHLTRIRRTIRGAVEQQLRQQHGLNDASIAECFSSVVDDAGSLDVDDLIGAMAPGLKSGPTTEHETVRKKAGQDRSR